MKIIKNGKKWLVGKKIKCVCGAVFVLEDKDEKLLKRRRNADADVGRGPAEYYEVACPTCKEPNVIYE